MLSKKAKYAIKALILLAKQADNGSLTASQIAETEGIPAKSLGNVLLNLAKAGYIYSKKGMNGGYTLTRPAKEIFMVDVVRLIDGPIAMISCASAYHYRRCDDCPVEETCSVRDLYLEIRAADLKILSNTSIADMLAKEENLAKALIVSNVEST
jgi:Rrf2 family protein